MTARMLWRDPAVRITLHVLPGALLAGTAWSIAYGESGRLDAVDMGAWWIIFTVWLVFGQFWRRAERWQLPLPVSARALWMSRVAAHLGGAFVLILIATIFSTIRSPHDLEILGVAYRLFGGMTLAIAAVMAMQPVLCEVQPVARLAVESFLRLASVLWITLQLAKLPAAWSLLSYGLAAAILAWTYRSVPGVYRVVPDSLAAERAAPHPDAGISGASLPWTVFRILLTWEWRLVGGMIGLLAVLPGSWQFSWLVLVMMPIMFVPVVQNLPAVAHLPVSRRLIFALGVFPVLILWLLGSAISYFAWDSAPGSILFLYQPGGPETLTWLQLRPDANTWAVIAVLCGLVFAGGQLIQFKSVGLPSDRRAARFFIGIVYALPALLLMWLTLSDSPWLPQWHEALRYHGARALLAVAGVFPSGWAAWIFSVACLAAIYRFVEMRFLQSEALGLPECGL